MKTSFQFTTKQVVEMAQFVAELTRQGMKYEVRQMVDGWSITLTGGF